MKEVMKKLAMLFIVMVVTFGLYVVYVIFKKARGS